MLTAKIKMRKILYIYLLMTLSLVAHAQKKYKIEVLNFNSVKSNKNIHKGARRLIGNVKFKQDSTIMECDSAYFYVDKNMFDAFSNVHLYKLGDTNSVNVRSDFLRHLGDRKMAQFRNNVVLTDTNVIMRTDSLDYDINADIGYYLYGAEIEDSASTLISKKGYYYANERNVYFKEKVVVSHNEGEYKLFTDTLRYNTDDKIVNFFGRSQMVVNDTNNMFADFGWYNTENNKALFKKNALLTSPTQSLEADSIFVDRTENYGKAFSNVIATDSVKEIVATGNYFEGHQTTESILITDSAMVKVIMEGDSIFIHADTIFSELDTANFKIDTIDTKIDTIKYRYFKAFHHVKVFKSDFQAKTDSLFFTTVDSIGRMFGRPVLWAEGTQITSKYMEAFIANEVLHKFKLYQTGFIVSQQDTGHYNQVTGKDVTGYFKDNNIHRIDIKNNCETYYFPDDEGEIVGINKAECENMSIYMDKNKVKGIIYRKQPKTTTYPLKDVQPKEMKMKNFIWLEDWRPKKPSDIFWWENQPNNKSIDVQKQEQKTQPKSEHINIDKKASELKRQ